MIKYIIKRFIKEDINTNDGREKLIGLSGVIGIICNALIVSFKLQNNTILCISSIFFAFKR